MYIGVYIGDIILQGDHLFLSWSQKLASIQKTAHDPQLSNIVT